MPSVSKKQARFMAAVAHGWKPKAKKAPPIAVAKEFASADKKKLSPPRRQGKRTIAEGY